MALAAIDIALWDLRGKAARAAALAHGGRLSRLCARLQPGDRLARPVGRGAGRGRGRIQEAGWSGVKLKIGKPHPAEDVARIAAVRADCRARALNHDRCKSAHAGGGATPGRACSRTSTSPVSREPLPETTSRATVAAAATAIPIVVLGQTCTPSASSGSTSWPERRASGSQTSRGWAASRRGSRSPTSPRRSTSGLSPHVRTEISCWARCRDSEWVVGREPHRHGFDHVGSTADRARAGVRAVEPGRRDCVGRCCHRRDGRASRR